MSETAAAVKKSLATPKIVVEARVREVIGEMKLAGDVIDALNEKVKLLVEDAVERARKNGRVTLQKHDI